MGFSFSNFPCPYNTTLPFWPCVCSLVLLSSFLSSLCWFSYSSLSLLAIFSPFSGLLQKSIAVLIPHVCNKNLPLCHTLECSCLPLIYLSYGLRTLKSILGQSAWNRSLLSYMFTAGDRVYTLLAAMEKYLKAVALFCGAAIFPSKYIYGWKRGCK